MTSRNNDQKKKKPRKRAIQTGFVGGKKETPAAGFSKKGQNLELMNKKKGERRVRRYSTKSDPRKE